MCSMYVFYVCVCGGGGVRGEIERMVHGWIGFV